MEEKREIYNCILCLKLSHKLVESALIVGDLEMRACTDEAWNNEAVALQSFEGRGGRERGGGKKDFK